MDYDKILVAYLLAVLVCVIGIVGTLVRLVIQ